MSEHEPGHQGTGACAALSLPDAWAVALDGDDRSGHAGGGHERVFE